MAHWISTQGRPKMQKHPHVWHASQRTQNPKQKNLLKSQLEDLLNA